jgi:hypothetical protein
VGFALPYYCFVSFLATNGPHWKVYRGLTLMMSRGIRNQPGRINMNRAAHVFTYCILSLAFSITVPAFHQAGSGGQPSKRSYPQHLNLPVVPFRDLKQGKVNQEQFNTEGYVNSIYECPPCPKGAQCKPCLGDHIIITETERVGKGPTDPDDHLLIFAKDPTQFKTGKRYLFSVKVNGRRKEGERIEQAELTGYDALEDGSKH